MFFPGPRQQLSDGDLSKIVVAGGFVSFSDTSKGSHEFKYLGAIIHYTLTIASDADIHYKLRKASAAFGALRECLISFQDDT
jgi:hypothetical protein